MNREGKCNRDITPTIAVEYGYLSDWMRKTSYGVISNTEPNVVVSSPLVVP